MARAQTVLIGIGLYVGLGSGSGSGGGNRAWAQTAGTAFSYLSTSGTWTNASDRNVKQGFEPIDVARLRGSR
jgi:hypothetical protein